jgi:RNA 2',3'-cyclic 3'-phosphodiesterase
MKHRLFISLELPEEFIKELENIQKQIIEQDAITGKYTPQKNIHLTLKFLGHIEEEKISEIITRLEEVSFTPSLVQLGKIGLFNNRIIWVELLGKSITDLQKEIDEKLKDLFPIEKRFMSHITLARIKKIDLNNLALNKITYSKVNSKVKSFNLMKSELSRKGPRYEIVKNFSFKF